MPRRQRQNRRFLSTPSGWRATCPGITSAAASASISIHALRVEGDRNLRNSLPQRLISIHALRVEGDRVCCIYFK